MTDLAVHWMDTSSLPRSHHFFSPLETLFISPSPYLPVFPTDSVKGQILSKLLSTPRISNLFNAVSAENLLCAKAIEDRRIV